MKEISILNISRAQSVCKVSVICITTIQTLLNNRISCKVDKIQSTFRSYVFHLHFPTLYVLNSLYYHYGKRKE